MCIARKIWKRRRIADVRRVLPRVRERYPTRATELLQLRVACARCSVRMCEGSKAFYDVNVEREGNPREQPWGTRRMPVGGRCPRVYPRSTPEGTASAVSVANTLQEERCDFNAYPLARTTRRDIAARCDALPKEGNGSLFFFMLIEKKMTVRRDGIYGERHIWKRHPCWEII